MLGGPGRLSHPTAARVRSGLQNAGSHLLSAFFANQISNNLIQIQCLPSFLSRPKGLLGKFNLKFGEETLGAVSDAPFHHSVLMAGGMLNDHLQ